MNSTPTIELTNEQAATSRGDLIAAFKRVIAGKGRPQATDLHVRRLLCYVRAKDVDGQGVQRSLRQLANRLVLNVSTCRRVIRRAVEEFGLLIVTPQRHVPGGQTVNRYRINHSAVAAPHAPGSTDVPVSSSSYSITRKSLRYSQSNAPVRADQPPNSIVLCLPCYDPVRAEPSAFRKSARAARTRARSNHILSCCANAIRDYSTRHTSPVMTDHPLNSSPRAPANEMSDMPVVLRLCPSGSDSCYDPVRLALELSDKRYNGLLTTVACGVENHLNPFRK